MKTSEIRDKGPSELETREKDLSTQLFKLRFQRSTGSLEKPSKMREVRREIARIKTILGEKKRAAESK
ncbi:MAG TPA: 50S ribosomal protein L29 [Thermoanaerobaculia bacterium]|nr:50S ribosomal protein L29 [Thermoanaerobaculia bacterium]